ncbi:bacteriohemerythrin [bacterium endosymbiont of Escarpia laminata]|nr:MAG: bacteriohemerythrin [bacterium endosymbiont of Escarpia laminata]
MEVIDNQHRRIAEYINELAVALHEKDREKEAQVLMRLVKYMGSHFAFEEALMERSGYPLSNSHRDDHDVFASQLRAFVEQQKSGKDVARRVMSELRIWLILHVKESDKNYAPHVMKTMDMALSRFYS